MHQHGVAARNERKDKRRLKIGCGEQIGEKMALEMVDADERHVCSIGKALGKCHAHYKRAHQARAWVTATAASSCGASVPSARPSARVASSSAASTTLAITSTCLREAISGTTPPNRA